MLQVRTAQERKYIIKQSFIVLMAGRPGEKNIPSLTKEKRKNSRVLAVGCEARRAGKVGTAVSYQTIPWLFTR